MTLDQLYYLHTVQDQELYPKKEEEEEEGEREQSIELVTCICVLVASSS